MSTRKIASYVDAVHGLRALQQAEADEGKTPERTAAIAAARTAMGLALRVLTGGELGQARRILAPNTTTASASSGRATKED